MLLLLAVLAVTSLAVYQKQSAVELSAIAHGSNTSIIVKEQADAEMAKLGTDHELKSSPISSKN